MASRCFQNSHLVMVQQGHPDEVGDADKAVLLRLEQAAWSRH
jgi:hypothetical protein